MQLVQERKQGWHMEFDNTEKSITYKGRDSSMMDFVDTLSCSSSVLCFMGTHQMLLTDRVRRWNWNYVPPEYNCAALRLWMNIRTQNFNNYRIIDKQLSTFYFMTTHNDVIILLLHTKACHGLFLVLL